MKNRFTKKQRFIISLIILLILLFCTRTKAADANKSSSDVVSGTVMESVDE